METKYISGYLGLGVGAQSNFEGGAEFSINLGG